MYTFGRPSARGGAVFPGKFVRVLKIEDKSCSHFSEQLRAIPKHPEAHLWPSEVVTLGLLHDLVCKILS